MTEAPERQRLDRWLWHARVVRTRALAQTLAASGHVRVNGVRAERSSRMVRIGDVLTIALEREVRVLRVRRLGGRRGGAADARCLFDDLNCQENPVDGHAARAG